MRILVTGSSGFVGRHIVDTALRNGHTVYGLDRKPKVRAIPNVKCDLADIDSFIVPEVDCIIHAAAYADIRNNWERGEADKLFKDNVTATHNLLKCAADMGTVNKFVFVSTASVYDGGGPHYESFYAEARSPYAASKLAGEAYCQAFGVAHGWETSVVRLTMCVGEGYHHGHVVDFVRMIDGGYVEAKDNGANRKDAVHVIDAAEAIVHVAQLPKDPRGVYNVASGELWNWTDTVRVLGYDLDKVVRADCDAGWVGDAVGLRVSTLRLLESGWSPKRKLEDGVREAAAYIRNQVKS